MLTIKRLLPEIIGLLLAIPLAFFFAWLCGTPLPWIGSAVRP